jgi:hypothetical protein
MLYPLSYGSETTDDIQRSTPHLSCHEAYVFRVPSVIPDATCEFDLVSLAIERFVSRSHMWRGDHRLRSAGSQLILSPPPADDSWNSTAVRHWKVNQPDPR